MYQNGISRVQSSWCTKKFFFILERVKNLILVVQNKDSFVHKDQRFDFRAQMLVQVGFTLYLFSNYENQEAVTVDVLRKVTDAARMQRDSMDSLGE